MTSNDFASLLKYATKASVLDARIPINKYIAVDLSVSNKDLETIDVGSSSALEYYIKDQIRKHNALVAFGGYNETRNIYQRSTYFNQTNVETERNIHLGVDLWIAADSPVYAPLDATVHSFKNNTNHGDYGPTIILKHCLANVEFFTLYGHLSIASIAELQVGQVFGKGQQIATLGDATVNGDYPPHLHFQIIKDMQGFEGDYPGVCNKKDLKFYLENCPDPGLLLGL